MPDDTVWKPKVNPWFIAAAVALAAFMEVLDTSIANVALPYIAGSLGASEDQATWVLTTYLVANAIVLPMGGWAATVLGRKNFFLLCITIFTIASVLCGLAPSLPLLLAFRVLQGAGGGGLQPMAQAIMADSFDPKMRSLAFALYGIVATLAPSIGPTLGGWITFSYSWKWIFFINVPVGILAFVLTSRLVEDPPWIKADAANFFKLDKVGIALLTLSMASLEIFLDKGEEWNWFGSTKIQIFFGIFLITFPALIWYEWRNRAPLMQLRLYTYKNFAICSALMLLTGGVLSCSTVLQPQLTQALFGYTPTLAGMTLSGGGIALLFMIPLAGRALKRFPARNMIALGFAIYAVGFFWSGWNLNLGVDFAFLTKMRILQVVGLPFIFISLTTASYFGIPKEYNNQVSGLINFARNLGGSILISLAGAFVTENQQFNRQVLVQHLPPSGQALQSSVKTLTAQLGGYSGPANSEPAALAWIYKQMNIQAGMLAYVHIYYLLALLSAGLFALTFVLSRNDPQSTELAHGE